MCQGLRTLVVEDPFSSTGWPLIKWLDRAVLTFELAFRVELGLTQIQRALYILLSILFIACYFLNNSL